jgi:hypothetical protein
MLGFLVNILSLTPWPAFFEGLAGNGADIDALFQIEDEINQSAIDMDDGSEYNVPHPSGSVAATGEGQRFPRHLASGQAINTSKRNPSVSSRRRSGAFAIDTQTPSVHLSPLAQLYQPLVLVDDDSSGGDENQGPNLGSSFVPRRRLASVTRTRRPSIEPFQPHSAPQHPPSHPARPGGPPPAEHMAMPIPPTTVPEDVALVTSPDEISSELAKRLVAIEGRQQRIENLLVALAGELRVSGNRTPKTNPLMNVD